MRSGPAGQFAFPAPTSAVKALLLINGGVFLVNAVFAGRLGDWLGLSLEGMLDLLGLGVLRIVTYQFVHSYVDLGHIFFNMLALYFFGSLAERDVGKKGLVKLYLTSGAVGGILQLLLYAVLGMDATVVGASGSCFGILVYAAFLAPRSKVWVFPIFQVELRWIAGFAVFAALYYTIMTLRHGPGSGGGTAHGAHLGGAVWGFVAFRYLRRFYVTADHRPFFGGLSDRLRRLRRERRAQADHERRAKLDALLDKVHREGMSALTGAERRFLERASRDFKRH